MKVKVRKQGLDWMMECIPHHQRVWCDSYESAYEAAAGHCVMHHPPLPKPELPKCILCDRPAMRDHIICLFHYYDL